MLEVFIMNHRVNSNQASVTPPICVQFRPDNAFTTFPKPYQFNPKKNGRKPAEQIWIANGATATFAVEYGPGVIVHPQGSPTAK
ncbi:hypothetical protein L8957_28875, partial [Klebsiella pneumoniae]|nr:hypothetical protein [Klebsiella pneumoniae]